MEKKIVSLLVRGFFIIIKEFSGSALSLTEEHVICLFLERRHFWLRIFSSCQQHAKVSKVRIRERKEQPHDFASCSLVLLH